MTSTFQRRIPSVFGWSPFFLSSLFALFPGAGFAGAGNGAPGWPQIEGAHFYEPAFVAKVKAGAVDARDIWRLQPNGIHFPQSRVLVVAFPEGVRNYTFTVEGSGPTYTLHLEAPSRDRDSETEGHPVGTLTWLSPTRIRTTLHSKNFSTEEELERVDLGPRQIIEQYDRRYRAQWTPSLVGRYRIGTSVLSFTSDGILTVNGERSEAIVLECENADHVRAPCLQVDAEGIHPAYRLENRDGHAVLVQGSIADGEGDYRMFQKTPTGAVFGKQ